MVAASGHRGLGNAAFAPEALEFFAFGFPQRRAVVGVQLKNGHVALFALSTETTEGARLRGLSLAPGFLT